MCNQCSAEYHITCLLQAYKDFKQPSSKPIVKSKGGVKQSEPASATIKSQHLLKPGLSSATQGLDQKDIQSAAKSLHQGNGSAVEERGGTTVQEERLEREARDFLIDTLGINPNAVHQRWTCLSCLMTQVYDLFCRAGTDGDALFF